MFLDKNVFSASQLSSCILLLALTACSGISDRLQDALDDALNDIVNAQGVAIKVQATGLDQAPQVFQLAPALFPASILDPDLDANEYDGMGVNVSLAQVDGLKIKLTGIGINERSPGDDRPGKGVALFDWSAEPKELEIAQGFNEALTATTYVVDPAGIYTSMAVSHLNQYDVKGFAYFDRNNDGDIDTTLWSTAAGVVTAPGILTREQMADYDYIHYGFMFTFIADDVENSTQPTGTLTVLDSPIEITAGASEITVTLLVDTFRLVSAWDGRFGNSWGFSYGVTGSIPAVVSPFPGTSETTDTPNQWGLKTSDFWQEGVPDFAIQYLPAYAFVNDQGITSQSYIVSPIDRYDVVSGKVFTVVMRDSQPLIGRFSINNGDGELHSVLRIGQVARLFEAQSGDAYKFYTDYRMEDDEGNSDGGLYYNSDAAMAGHIVEGFELLSAVGVTGTAELKDGPRCSGEYDYCLYSIEATPSTTFYYKRIK